MANICGVGINSITGRPSGVITILPDSTQSRGKLRQALEEKLDGRFQTKVGIKKSPHVIIHDVRRETTQKEVTHSIASQNNLSIQPDEIKLIFSIKGKDPGRCSMV